MERYSKIGMRLFHLQRDEDIHGVSGVGMVAQGVVFDDGRVSMRWVSSDAKTTVMFDSIDDVQEIHGHDGKTKVVFEDTNEVLSSKVHQVVAAVFKKARVYYPDPTQDGSDTIQDVLDRIINRPKEMSVTELQEYLKTVGFDFDPHSHRLDQIR